MDIYFGLSHFIMSCKRMWTMMASLFILSALSAPVMAGAPPAPFPFASAPRPACDSPRQAVVVKISEWTAQQGILKRYERLPAKETWQAVGDAVPVVVGRNGLGWGVGLHPAATLDGPEKREGDGRSPAGVFRLSSAFGYAPAKEAAGIKLPYMEATPSLRCVDDAQSPHYNRIVDSSLIKPDWKSDEEMRRADDHYRLGIVVDHNTNPVIPGRGSCIFIHIWKGSDVGTAGCTAMSQENMERLLRWLDPLANPILIQLPEGTYRQLRTGWDLP